ncbi:ArsR/SmtB family transcription factor [Phenylobacterium montanum]|uniref:Helix-turn-helix transcriptional regulator n=1 Tax=Phenylobacterium montanum TaxID=2823693 RepID=A0A975FZA3_9CAUL|nr:helix-turn-helix transcriptional regulator [Caulobacter sp. S6]QUD88228.1 helix-turn-helix transcriptional regulator [Caulobacter sp. S6]
MTTTAQFAEIAALAGDPARAAMLQALMDGRALTASELAGVAGVTPQTASGHLARMTTAGLMAVTRQGRHRYHRLASASVARMIESIMQVAGEAPAPARRLSTGPRDAAMRAARTCYDHIAGQLGVAICDSMTRRGFVELEADAGEVTEAGLEFLAGLGLSDDALADRRGKRSGRLFCRPCLDWSERRPHLAGVMGAALCRHCLDQGWVRRLEGARALAISPKGQSVFRDRFQLQLG